MLFNSVEQHCGLQPIGARSRACLLHDLSGVNCFLHRGDHQPNSEVGHPAIPELKHLSEIMAGVNMHHHERQLRWPEGFLGDVQHDDAVLATREQQTGILKLGGHLAEDVNRFRFELAKIGEVKGHQRQCYGQLRSATPITGMTMKAIATYTTAYVRRSTAIAARASDALIGICRSVGNG